MHMSHVYPERCAKSSRPAAAGAPVAGLDTHRQCETCHGYRVHSAASRRQLIVMVQPSKQGHGDNPARATTGLYHRWNRDPLAEPLMRS